MFIMGLNVCRVSELQGNPGILTQLVEYFTVDFEGASESVASFRGFYIDTVGHHQGPSLDTEAFGNDLYHIVSFGSGDESPTNARVSRCNVDNRMDASEMEFKKYKIVSEKEMLWYNGIASIGQLTVE